MGSRKGSHDRVKLQEGTSVFGVLAEPWIVEGQREITEFGGWREHVATIAESDHAYNPVKST